MSEDRKFINVHYQSYLQLEKVLGAQEMRSAKLDKPAHDEMLFIITHQAYELWFKQILHELGSVSALFKAEKIDERTLGTAVSRLNRVVDIQNLIIDQIRILETMTPLDFLEFRNYLFPASGFQSFQFRQVEVLLGLEDKKRITYNKIAYDSPFDPAQQEELKKTKENNLFDLVEIWLERTPFLQFQGFDFLSSYQSAVNRMIEKERLRIEGSKLSSEDKEQRLKMLGNTDSYYELIFNEEQHKKLMDEGQVRLSYKATLAALLINLYRDEPILHQPYRLLNALSEIDELFTTWRYRHAQMVLRMLGKKIGTGGSSGHDYLQNTALRHHIFSDLHNISTLLIPRSELPDLPEDVRKMLGFYYTSVN